MSLVAEKIQWPGGILGFQFSGTIVSPDESIIVIKSFIQAETEVLGTRSENIVAGLLGEIKREATFSFIPLFQILCILKVGKCHHLNIKSWESMPHLVAENFISCGYSSIAITKPPKHCLACFH